MSTASFSEIDIFQRFGKKSVFPTCLTIDAWNHAIRDYQDKHKIHCLPSDITALLRYAEETISELLETRKWIFVFDPGFSIKKIHAIIGTSSEMKPHFERKSTWWVEEDWAFEESMPAFYLISVPMFKNRSWRKQEEAIKLMGINYCRAPLRIVVATAATWVLLNKLRVPFRNSQHWGNDGICFDFSAFSFAKWPLYCNANQLGACVLRRFDF